MADNRPDVLLVGPSKPLLAKGLSPVFNVHRLIEATDREAFLSGIADRIRAFAVTYSNQKIDAAITALGNITVPFGTAITTQTVQVQNAMTAINDLQSTLEDKLLPFVQQHSN